MADQQTREQRLEQALRDLIRAYVNTLENGRDRIVFLGGDCDPVDVMERSDPSLNAAKAALAIAGVDVPRADQLIEAVARVIYEQWTTLPGFVPWVEGGNSLKQDAARSLAKTAIAGVAVPDHQTKARQ